MWEHGVIGMVLISEMFNTPYTKLSSPSEEFKMTSTSILLSRALSMAHIHPHKLCSAPSGPYCAVFEVDLDSLSPETAPRLPKRSRLLHC